jgi:hypothetical protein
VDKILAVLGTAGLGFHLIVALRSNPMTGAILVGFLSLLVLPVLVISVPRALRRPALRSPFQLLILILSAVGVTYLVPLAVVLLCSSCWSVFFR